LQELLAPRFVEFYSHDWTEIGTKSSMQETVEQVAGVGDINAQGECVAEKMSWASHRETTRIEDEAYCLMCFFGINMPLLYGEGEKALFRLQSEIWAQTGDESIFAWEHPAMRGIPLTSRYVPPLFRSPGGMETRQEPDLQSITINRSRVRLPGLPIRNVPNTDDLSLLALKSAWFRSELVRLNGITQSRSREDGDRQGLVDAITLDNRGIDMDFSPRRMTIGSSSNLASIQNQRASEDFLLPLYCEPILDLRCYAHRIVKNEYGGWHRAPQLEMLSPGDEERARQKLTRRELRAHFPHNLTMPGSHEKMNGDLFFPGVIFIAPSFKMYSLCWESIPSISSAEGNQSQVNVLYPKVIKRGPDRGAMYAAMRFIDG
jgi:hypothetical protein